LQPRLAPAVLRLPTLPALCARPAGAKRDAGAAAGRAGGAGSRHPGCAEQILRSGAAACLLAWLPESRLGDYRALRRLQLAAQGSASLAFLFRPPQAAHSLSPAALRIVLRVRGSLAVEILKQRGGQAGQQITLVRANTLLQPRIDLALLPSPWIRPRPASAGQCSARSGFSRTMLG
jgi:hypothetical protein